MLTKRTTSTNNDDILVNMIGTTVSNLSFVLLYQRTVARKEINTVAKTKNTKACKNYNNCIGNKRVKSSNSLVCKTC